MQGLRSHTSVDDEDDIADLKVMKILEQRLWHHTSGSSAYSHMYGDHDDLRIPNPARIAEVDGIGWNLETLQHDGVRRWCDLYSAQPFGESCGREGERGGGGQRPRR
jgi:hypothetical protein